MARRKYKKKPSPTRQGEVPTQERRSQLGGTVTEVRQVETDGRIQMIGHRAKIECMLDAYLLRELIGREEYRAGIKYRIAWLRARGGIRVSDRFGAGGPVSYEESLLIIPESERILKEAHTVLTPAQKAIILRVCVDDKKTNGTDSRETLCRGLVRLAKKWRML